MFYISAILCLSAYFKENLPSILNLQKKFSCAIHYCQDEQTMSDQLISIVADVKEGTILRRNLCDMNSKQLEDYINRKNPYIILLEDGEGHYMQDFTDSFQESNDFVPASRSDVNASSMLNDDVIRRGDNVFNLERYFTMNFNASRFQPLYGSLNRFFFPENDRAISISSSIMDRDIMPLIVEVFNTYLNPFRFVQKDANYDGRGYTGRDKIRDVAKTAGYNEEQIAFEIFEIFLKSRQEYPEDFLQIKAKIATRLTDEGFKTIHEQWGALTPLERAIAYLYSLFSPDTRLESIWRTQGTGDAQLDFITSKAGRFPKILRSALYSVAKNFGPIQKESGR